MKLQVLQENLADAITLTSRFASSRAQLPILGNILFSTTKNKLLLSSTNLEISVVTSIGAKVENEGSLAIPARIINDLVVNLASGTIDLVSEKEQLKISNPNYSFEISGMNSSDFPSIPTSIDRSLSLTLPKKEFVQKLSKVIFATSIDETRPILTGVLFIFEKDSLVLVATDGFRLSQTRLLINPLPKKLNLGKVILPKNALNEIGKLSEDEESFDFCFKEKENQAIFGVGETVLSTRTLEGNFPDFEKIIPKDSIYKVLLDKEEFLRAVRLGSVFAKDSANIVKISLKEDFIEISTESQSGNQRGKVDAKIEGLERAGRVEGFEIAFNYRFLEDFLHAVDGEEVAIELSSSDKPGVFIDTSDKNFLHLIMPVMVQG